MKRNVLNKAATEQIITRVAALQKDSKPKWSMIDATEILLHCNIFKNQVLEEEISYWKSTIKQQLLRTITLNIAPSFPKNFKG